MPSIGSNLILRSPALSDLHESQTQLGSFLGPPRQIAVNMRPTPNAPHLTGGYAMLPIEAAIIEKLRSGSCCFDDVVTDLPSFSWGEVFVAVDRMSRDGRVFLRQLGYSTYQISLDSQFAYSSSTSGQKGTMPIPQVSTL